MSRPLTPPEPRVTHTPHTAHNPPPEPESPPVPAEDVPNQGDRNITYGETLLRPHRGTTSAGTPPRRLRQIEMLIRRWGDLERIAADLLGSPQRGRMVIEALLIQHGRGALFAGSRYLAAKAALVARYDRRVYGFVDCPPAQGGRWLEKGWDRCLARLRDLEVVETTRLYRQNGQASVNLIDLRRLWELLLRLLAQRRLIIERRGWRVWVKLGAVWISLETLCASVGGLGTCPCPSDTDPPP